MTGIVQSAELSSSAVVAALPTPYYVDRLVTLYNCACDLVLPSLVSNSISLLITDPPYGISEDTCRSGRGNWDHHGNFIPSNYFVPVHGDDKPFDPTHLLRFPRLILFGANYYANMLPMSNSWIVWDKLNGLTSKRTVGFNNNADCEMAWTNLGGPARIFRHRWTGFLKESEHKERRTHPTQKPIALMNSIIEWRTHVGDTVLDPYAGTGSTVLGAVDAACKVIACEIETEYCAVIVERLLSFYRAHPDIRYR